MWGRLKRRILRSKTGGVYSSSQDEGFSECRDTYRDFREELYDDSKENTNSKEGKSGKKMSLTKTPFPNLDRCACGTPGGKNTSEILVRSETLKRKCDFTIGTDGKSKGSLMNNTNNEYTSTSTGPGTRNRPQSGEETRMRGSTSTGQIPASVDEETSDERNGQRMNSCSVEIRRRRMTYSDDDGGTENDEDEEDMEEEESEDADDQFHPSTSKPFRNSSPSDGAKSSSNSSDYTSLAFDLNYVKVSPPKLRRRRKKVLETSAPLMIRRRRSIPKPLPDHPTRSGQKASNVEKLEGVDAGPPSGRPKEDTAALSNPSEHQNPNHGTDNTTKQSLNHSVTNDCDQQHFGYISWSDARHLLPQNKGVSAAAANETVKCESSAEPATRTNCEISTSGSLLQFTFTVRLDNDVIRGTRRDSDQATIGPSLVSGRVDMLSSGFVSTSENISIRSQIPPSSVRDDGRCCIVAKQQETDVNSGNVRATKNDNQSPAKHEKQLKTTVTFSQTRNIDTQSTEEEAVEEVRDGSKGECIQRSVEENSANIPPLGSGIPTGNTSAVSSTGCKQQTLADVQSNHGTTVTTTAIVHKSASEVEGEEDRKETEKRETKHLDSIQINSKQIESEESGLDEVDFAPKRQFNNGKPSMPLKTTDSDNEQTHMNWDEVMLEAESLGIPLTRPAAHCVDCSRGRPTAPTSNASPSKQSDGYWVCSNCTETMHIQQQQQRSSRKTESSKTSSPFKEKFKLQTIFGGKRTKEEKTGRTHEVVSYPPAQRNNSPSPKYKTMPGSAAATITHSSPDIHKCIWAMNRNGKETSRGRSMSPALTVRCGTSTSSPKASSSNRSSRGDTRGQHRISHLCSPPQLRCRFSYGRTVKLNNRPSSASENPSTKLSSDVLESSSSPVVKRRPNAIDRDFLKSLAQLMGCSWYWGSLSFESAEEELSDRTDGCFLVRDSSDDRYILSISFRSLKSTHHIRIERHEGMFSFSSEQRLHESSDIVEFIESAIELSQGGQCLYHLRPRTPNSPSVPVQLLYPLSRFAQ